jgi:LPXTG-site transpeptidase (sortase) family protein
MNFQVYEAWIPPTGFPQGQVTELPAQPDEKTYNALADSGITLEIPTLGVRLPIVGVPLTENGWDVTWLGWEAGYLQGTAFPTRAGNTVITAHVWDAFNNPGPFAKLKNLKYGDRFFVHAWGLTYTYEVRENRLVRPTNILSLLKHEELDWVTLFTCEGYKDSQQAYSYRRVVRAILINISSELKPGESPASKR